MSLATLKTKVEQLIEKAQNSGNTDELEAIIDNSGVLDSTDGTATDKVNALIDLAEKGKTDTLRARLTNTLIEYNILDAVSLPVHAFSNCSNLIKFSAPNLINTAHNATFQGCSNLLYADMGKTPMFSSVDINSCHKLTTIIFRNTEQVVTLGGTFTNVNSITKENYTVGGKLYYCYFYVPKALIEDYKNATNWSNYAHRFRAIEDYPEEVNYDNY